jgi:hypothetical protein
MQHNGWDRALKVTADGTGLIGHAGAVLLRKAAGQAGLVAGLSGALRKKGTSPAFDRGAVLVSLAAAIALGATSMSDIALLAHLAPCWGRRRAGRRCAGPWTWPGRRPRWTGSPAPARRPARTCGA